MNSVFKFFQKPIFYDKRLIFILWIGAALVAGLGHLNKANNYQIFKYVFYHTIEQVNLYAEYPDKYFDSNHYGPLFSIVIAPFALLPDFLGIPLWEMLIAATLLVAIYKLPMSWKGKVIIYWIAILEVYLNATNSQTNTLIAALIIGSFICIKSEKDFWAACFIMLGLFIKLYGIVGLAFFFFSKHKPKLIGYHFLHFANDHIFTPVYSTKLCRLVRIADVEEYIKCRLRLSEYIGNRFGATSFRANIFKSDYSDSRRHFVCFTIYTGKGIRKPGLSIRPFSFYTYLYRLIQYRLRKQHLHHSCNRGCDLVSDTEEAPE